VPKIGFLAQFSPISGSDKTDQLGKPIKYSIHFNPYLGPLRDSSDKTYNAELANLLMRARVVNTNVGSINPNLISKKRSTQEVDNVRITNIYQMNDISAGDQPSLNDDYYAFVRYRRGSRGRLAILNEEIFIIDGSNGIICILVLVLWTVSQLSKIYIPSAKFTKICVQITRFLMGIFFIKFIFIAFVELGVHDLVRD
jgi:hypothetical protein